MRRKLAQNWPHASLWININFRLDFEETYDGLGDQLDETDDAFNDDTFGAGSSSKKPAANDFDFFGRTAKVSDAISEEQARYSRQQPLSRVTAPPMNYVQSAPKPSRTGYERYREPDYIPDMQVDANLWGVAPKKPAAPAVEPSQASGPSGGRKMMSLEEVEAAMRAQPKKPTQPVAPEANYPTPPPQPQYEHSVHQDIPVQSQQQQYYGQHDQPVQDAQRQPQPIHILQRPQQAEAPQPPTQPRHIMQNPNRYPGAEQGLPPQQQHGHPQQHRPGHHHQSRGSGQRHIITHPQQLANLSEEDRAAFLKEDAKRAKRNHKIFLLSKDNGLMTPQDKNFITRIQLQQLVTATGNPNEHGSDTSLAEDFYYQVHNSIQGASRQHPGQPLSNFAQTYLFQTGGRHGNMRRGARGGDNHMQRMAQQVQRAVEAAKNKPKNKQLVIEGSLGKISFSNAKTPKPLLNFKRTESGVDANKPGSSAKDRKQIGVSDRKTALRNIEHIYDTLMKVEQHAQQMPFIDEQTAQSPEVEEWKSKEAELRAQLWDSLKVHEPIGETPVHPFIAIISYNKGKKAIPRVYRHITKEQRTTILTMIVVHLDQLDVIRDAVPAPGENQPRISIREDIETFNAGIMNPLFNFLNEVGLDIVSGLVSLICNLNLFVIARTRIGVSVLAMLLSRAELIRSSGEFSEAGWQDW